MDFKEFRRKRKLTEATSVAPTSVSDGQHNVKMTDDKQKEKKKKDEEKDCEDTDKGVNEAADPQVLKKAYMKTMHLEHIGYGYYKDPSKRLWQWVDSICRFKEVDEKNAVEIMTKNAH